MPSLHVLVRLGQGLYELAERLTSMLSTKEQLEWVRNWRRRHGGHYQQPAAHALKALEEMVELCFASGCSDHEVVSTVAAEIGKARQKGEVTKTLSRDKVAEELADVTVCLCVIAVEGSYDVPAAVAAKIPVLESREWSPDARGVLRRSRMSQEAHGPSGCNGVAPAQKEGPERQGPCERPSPCERPTVVCLCGSSRFRTTWEAAMLQEELAGRITLAMGFYGHHMPGFDMTDANPVKRAADELHLRKIEMADEVLVLDVGGYIGDSTRREIVHATGLGKPVRYWSQERNSTAGVHQAEAMDAGRE